jgi:hypothetical protein
VSVLLSLIASSGFWLYVGNRKEKKSLQTELLIGLAHDRITYLGLKYLQKGWICQDEYENLVEYLYKPYDKLGGNGSARRIMAEIEKLPIKTLWNRNNNIGENENEVFE